MAKTVQQRPVSKPKDTPKPPREKVNVATSKSATGKFSETSPTSPNNSNTTSK